MLFFLFQAVDSMVFVEVYRDCQSAHVGEEYKMQIFSSFIL